jgi:hypothetical protein
MNRRVRKIANFFAFNLLFFALYLNFIHKDNTAIPASTNMAGQQHTTPAFSGTVLVESTGQFMPTKNEATAVAPLSVPQKTNSGNEQALKLSIN